MQFSIIVVYWILFFLKGYTYTHHTGFWDGNISLPFHTKHRSMHGGHVPVCQCQWEMVLQYSILLLLRTSVVLRVVLAESSTSNYIGKPLFDHSKFGSPPKRTSQHHPIVLVSAEKVTLHCKNFLSSLLTRFTPAVFSFRTANSKIQFLCE